MPDSLKLSAMKPGLIKILDQRKVDLGSGTPIGEGNKKSADVDPVLIREIVSKAKRSGFDPTTHLAMALRENALTLPAANKYFPDPLKAANPFQVGSKDEFGPNKLKIGEWMAANPGKNSIDAFNQLYKEKMAIADSKGVKDEAARIQHWNGTGTLANKGLQYGIDTNKTPINMDQNPIYGKSVLDLRENVIKKNPELMKLVDSIPAAQADQVPVTPKTLPSSPLQVMTSQQLANPLSLK